MKASAVAIMANNAAEAAKTAEAVQSLTAEGLIAAAVAAEAEGAKSGVVVLAALTAALITIRFPIIGDEVPAAKAAEAVRLAYGMTSDAWQKSNRKKQTGVAQKVAADYAARAEEVRTAADGGDAVQKVIGWFCNLTGVNNSAAVTVESVRNVYYPPRRAALSDDAKAERKIETLLASIAGLDRPDLFDVVRAAVARKRALDNPGAAAREAGDIGAQRRAKSADKAAEAAAKVEKADAATIAGRASRRAKAAEAAAALEAAAKAAEADADAAANG